jgi:hypothetical protein
MRSLKHVYFLRELKKLPTIVSLYLITNNRRRHSYVNFIQVETRHIHVPMYLHVAYILFEFLL